jgi:tripartite-type tricarboxylate transporter receptor subunit TctC
VLERLHTALSAALHDGAQREKLEAQGCEVAGGSPQALAQLVRQDQARWGRIIRERHITLE